MYLRIFELVFSINKTKNKILFRIKPKKCKYIQSREFASQKKNKGN